MLLEVRYHRYIWYLWSGCRLSTSLQMQHLPKLQCVVTWDCTLSEEFCTFTAHSGGSFPSWGTALLSHFSHDGSPRLGVGIDKHTQCERYPHVQGKDGPAHMFFHSKVPHQGLKAHYAELCLGHFMLALPLYVMAVRCSLTSSRQSQGPQPCIGGEHAEK